MRTSPAVIFIFTYLHQALALNVEETLGKCKHSQVDAIEKCIMQTVQDLKPLLKNGIPEIELPPLEPLQLENIAFTEGSGSVAIKALFTDVIVQGISDFNMTDLKVDYKGRKVQYGVSVPKLRVTGTYELNGQVFIVPVRGSGPFWLLLEGGAGSGVSSLVESGDVTSRRKRRLQLTDTDFRFRIQNIRLRLNNLFNGDPILGETVNAFVNENSQDILEEVEPQVVERVGTVVQIISNQVLRQVPLESLPGAEYLSEQSLKAQ